MSDQKNSKAKNNNALVIAIIAALISVLVLCLCFKNFFMISFQGLIFIDRNQNQYDCNKTEIDDEIEFSFLSEEDKKIAGKNIYDKNNCKIAVAELRLDEEQPIIIFRAYGDYSLSGAQLVTCVDHQYGSDGYGNVQLAAGNLTCSYNGNDYECPAQGFTWCNFKDGNLFGYYLPKDLTLQMKKGIVEINFHLKGLLKYNWSKK